MQRFTIPRDVYFGENALDHLKSIEGKKAFIVIGSDRTIKDGTTGKIQAYLKEAKIESTIFSGVEVGSTVETVLRGAKEMLNYQPDLIIGVGGGSPLDAAKAMWIFMNIQTLLLKKRLSPFLSQCLERKLVLLLSQQQVVPVQK